MNSRERMCKALNQLLGLVEPEVRALLGIDTLPIRGLRTNFGFKNERWKSWRLFDGPPALIAIDRTKSSYYCSRIRLKS